MTDRAWVMLGSGWKLDLLDPSPYGFEDRDLAVGLSRTYRWAGCSRWEEPLSVAQHSLTVLAICRKEADRLGMRLSPGAALRELLHDAPEFFCLDPITPLKPHLGEGYARIANGLAAAVAKRYVLPDWTAAERRLHKRADRLAAASEATHVVGWTAEQVRSVLGMELEPLDDDPLPVEPGRVPWEPWPSRLAARRFLEVLTALSAVHLQQEALPPIPERGPLLRPPLRTGANGAEPALPDGPKTREAVRSGSCLSLVKQR